MCDINCSISCTYKSIKFIRGFSKRYIYIYIYIYIYKEIIIGRVYRIILVVGGKV